MKEKMKEILARLQQLQLKVFSSDDAQPRQLWIYAAKDEDGMFIRVTVWKGEEQEAFSFYDGMNPIKADGFCEIIERMCNN